MQKLTQHINVRNTPQNKPIPGEDQVENLAGGYVYEIDHWSVLNRFLIIGTEGGCYYASENKLTLKAGPNLFKCLNEDGKRFVDTIVDVSDRGLAKKNDMALFALAMASGAESKYTRKYALAKLHKVARTATHLFIFLEYLKAFRGRGRLVKEAVQRWYQNKEINSLAYQLVKYKNREGWKHADVLRLVKPVPKDDQHNWLYGYVTGKINYEEGYFVRRNGEITQSPAPIIEGCEKALVCTNKKELVKLITDHRLTHEMIPNEMKKHPEVWDALLQNMPITAMIRNLGKMTSVGLLKPMSDASKYITSMITDKVILRKGRVHPITILAALKIYQKGSGDRGGLEWNPVGKIVDALDEAFYLAYGAVQPTGKKIVLALDVSGSMGWTNVMGMPYMTAREISAALALVTMNVEDDYVLTVFSHNIQEFSGITPKTRLDDAIKKISDLDFGSTDCALPMYWALDNGIKADAFYVITDNETWAGRRGHPSQALKEYRRKMTPDAKLIVGATTATNFSIADPKDRGMLDVAGFSTDTPNIVSSFIRGDL